MNPKLILIVNIVAAIGVAAATLLGKIDGATAAAILAALATPSAVAK